MVLAALFYRYGSWRKGRLEVPMPAETDGHARGTVEQAHSLNPVS